MDSATADRVRAVISKLGMSNKEFAEAIGMPVDQLSKALNGKRRLSAFELAVIADLGSTTVDWLSTGTQRQRLGLAARAIGLETVEYEDEAQQIASRFANAAEVLIELGIRPEPEALPQLKQNGWFVDEGEAMAKWALEQLNPDVLLTSTVELVSAVEEAFGVDIANSTELPVGFDGLSFQNDHLRLILLLTTENWTRRRFTLAHELGHVLWADARDYALAEELRPGIDNSHKEKRANAFAAAFLMPESLIEQEVAGEKVTVELFHRLILRFKVSPSSMAVRLNKLGLLDQVTFARFRRFRTRDSIDATGSSKIEAQEIAAAQAAWAPTHMVADFLTAYREGRITSKPLVELTGQPEWAWRELLNDDLDLYLAQPGIDLDLPSEDEDIYAP
ncbi:XRE family transcriptional regulator [Protaetiibacter intestinalis]|uniref:ImmA/IrrE family metallo-endopeptidase n=1 Tax=Protaetiibacter intestinalis TaxID=2419774 RepID=A0A387B4E9_9MICO|nr:XRE family transcriptional regulator [Protaetiibacter intestinalis]AYF97187.1 ImmA/IrrE family metallo-endopeptidase [Protaetiibacter intestinalis]